MNPLKYLPNSWMIVGAIVFLLLAFSKVYSIGFGYGSAKADAQINAFKIKIEQEYSKQLEASIENEKKAKEYERSLIAQLEVAEEKIDELMEQNKQEAEADPDKDKCGISGESAKRLNRIR